MKRYERYKPSGIEWVGEIPEHWDNLTLKWVTRFFYGESLRNEDREKGDVPVFGSNGIVGYHSKAITEAPCLIIGRKGSYGKINYSDSPCFPIDTTYFIDRRATKNNLRWLFYVLSVLRLDAYSKDSAVPGLSREEAYENILPVPTRDEQIVIANYLDRKTGQIDDLITKKQKLIDLLDEEKTAIINHAVTKGLNPNAPLKDSGIPWVGKIPAHWRTKKIKHTLLRNRTALKTGPFGSQLKTTDFALNGRYKVYNQRNVLEDDFDLGDDFINDHKFTELKEFEILPDDILITTRGTIGKCAIFPTKKHKGVLHPCLIRIQVDERIVLIDWITNYINNSSLFMNAVLLESNATTIDVIYGADLKEIVIPVPGDLVEQRDILEYINNQLLRTRETTRKINKEIELLQEYRTALISEAATGKIDIRGVDGNDALCRMGT